MPLVRIALRRGRELRPTAAPAARATVSRRVLGVGIILLLPLAEPALHSPATLALLLVCLGALGLIAALLCSGGTEIESP